jgi:hypothetical protein
MLFEIIVDCIMALGALATAATFILVVIFSVSRIELHASCCASGENK